MVEFCFFAPQAKKVCLAGTFNNWDTESHPMEKDAEGYWRISLLLSPGRYEYKFLFDGSWYNDPTAKEVVSNVWGNENSVITIE